MKFLHFFPCWEPISTCLDPNPIRVRILNTGLISVVKRSSKCRVFAGGFGQKNKNKNVVSVLFVGKKKINIESGFRNFPGFESGFSILRFGAKKKKEYHGLAKSGEFFACLLFMLKKTVF
jgi:hypothetical protein